MGIIKTGISLFYLLDAESTAKLRSVIDQPTAVEKIDHELENGWNICCSSIDNTSIEADQAEFKGVDFLTIGPMQNSSLLHIRFAIEDSGIETSVEDVARVVSNCNNCGDIVAGKRLADCSALDPLVLFSSSFHVETGSGHMQDSRLREDSIPTVLEQIRDNDDCDKFRQRRQVSILDPTSYQLTIVEFPSSTSADYSTGALFYCWAEEERCEVVFESGLQYTTLWVAVCELQCRRLEAWESKVGDYRGDLQGLSKNYSFQDAGALLSRAGIRDAINSKATFYDTYRNVRDDCFIADQLNDCLTHGLCTTEVELSDEEVQLSPETCFKGRAEKLSKLSADTQNQFDQLRTEYGTFAEQLAQDSNLLLSLESHDLQRSVRALTIATVLIGGANLFASEIGSGSNTLWEILQGSMPPPDSLSDIAIPMYQDMFLLGAYVLFIILLFVYLVRSRI